MGNENELNIMLEYEYKLSEFKDITYMLWLVYEDYYSIQEKDIYVKADNYDRLRFFLFNIHTLLYNTTKNMENTLNNIYQYKKYK